MRLELGADPDFGSLRIVPGIRLAAGRDGHDDRIGPSEFGVERGNLGANNLRGKARPTAEFKREAIRRRHVIKDGSPTFPGEVEFFFTGLRPFVGQIHVIGKVLAVLRIAAIEQTNRVVEPLLVRAMNIPPGRRLALCLKQQSFRGEPEGGIIGQVLRGVFFEKRVQQQDRGHICRVFFLPEHGQVHQIDDRVPKFMVQDRQQVRLDKGVFRGRSRGRREDRSNQGQPHSGNPRWRRASRPRRRRTGSFEFSSACISDIKGDKPRQCISPRITSGIWSLGISSSSNGRLGKVVCGIAVSPGRFESPPDTRTLTHWSQITDNFVTTSRLSFKSGKSAIRTARRRVTLA